MTVLLSLFMFQSLWNVAAAFCAHENLNHGYTVTSQFHFGHHVALNCEQNQQHSHDPKQTVGIQMSEFISQLDDDHSDHLPSFAHFIVADVSQQADQPKFVAYPESAFIDWKNLYQSPDLFLPNPPPASAPL
ncbi:cation efflux protein, CzcI-like [Acinetobacter chinensis]|uniref:cation efflux protein, CzcI-like n=1 Tax=Acinetobacter chinensis TaxID=2004650 RepID=UPI002934AB9B|nr:cation efflux protein, CzcI-like [Acinetobacter chinensis]WOE41378.1 cation transporter [Acinetobacter chinensis]